MAATLVEPIIFLMERDVKKLSEEISLYPTEESLWTLAGDIKNTPGNLCLHLCGNLQHFIGHILGGTDYTRNRDYEFSAKNVSKATLLKEIDKTFSVLRPSLTKLDNSKWESPYPLEVYGEPITNAHFLIHLCAHLGYHLGQVNYHRRILASGK